MSKRKRVVRVVMRRISLGALEQMDSERLMNIWVKLGASSVGHSTAQGDLKGYVANLATSKSCQRRGDSDAAFIYRRIADACRESFRRATTKDVRFYL
jgi:hypothetical protein